MNATVHPTDTQWEQLAKAYYRKAYPKLQAEFQKILQRAFLRCHWIPEPLALEYLTKILIRFLPVSTSKNVLEEILEKSTLPEDPRRMIRFYENIGEFILWWSGLLKKSIFQSEGKRSYKIAYEQLSDFELPSKRVLVIPGKKEQLSSKRLQLNKMFSEQFENYQEILEKAELIEDPTYLHFRELFMTDDFSIN